MPTTLRQDLENFQTWAKSTFRQHRKLIILAFGLYFVYRVTAYPVMRWFGMWPAPVWFSYLLSAIFVVACFGVSKVRAFGLLLLCPLATLASWFQSDYANSWIYENFWEKTSNRWLQILMPHTSSHLLGTLMLTLLLLLAIVPQRPRLTLILGFITFASICNLVSGIGNWMQAGSGNYDVYGYNLGVQCFVSTLLASLAFERIIREPAEQ